MFSNNIMRKCYEVKINHEIIHTNLKDTCFCLKNGVSSKPFLTYEVYKQEIILCGYPSLDPVDSGKAFGGINIFNCTYKKVIDSLFEDDYYTVHFLNDTLSLNYYSICPQENGLVIKNILIYQKLYIFKLNGFRKKIILNPFVFLNAEQQKTLKTKYLKFKLTQLIFQNNDTGLLSEFLTQLIFGALSGDVEAKRRLLNFHTYYGTIDGAYNEILLERINFYNKLVSFSKEEHN
jgi:hypothetical protein